MGVNLTPGAITTMCNIHLFSEKLKPVLQVIELKSVQLQQDNSTDRYLLVISDGSHYHHGMLATMKNELVRSGRLQKGSIVRFTQLIYNVAEHCNIVYIAELEVILDKYDLIGDPVPAPKNDCCCAGERQFQCLEMLNQTHAKCEKLLAEVHEARRENVEIKQAIQDIKEKMQLGFLEIRQFVHDSFPKCI